MVNFDGYWISAFPNDDIANPQLSNTIKDVYNGFKPDELPKDTKAFLYGKDFNINKEIISAEIRICGLGYFEGYINGFKISEDVLTPSFSVYNKTIYYSSYDITNYIQEENRLGIILGSGFYNQYEDDEWNYGTAPWRGQNKFLADLTLHYLDGTSEHVITDKTWKYSECEIQYQNIRSGEYHDMNLHVKNWDETSSSMLTWENVYIHKAPKAKIKKEIIKPIRKFEEAEVVSIKKISDDIHIVTLDKNIAGWAKINLKGNKGDIVKCEFTDKFNKDTYDVDDSMKVYTNNLFQTFTIKLSGKKDICEPKFCYFGFQYIKIYGLKYTPEKEDFTIYSVHNSFKKHGDFWCNNETINKIHNLCTHTYINNWQSIPTDCPQREKNGWTCDGWLASEYGLINYDSLNGYKKWLDDMLDDQKENKDFSPIIPNPDWDMGKYNLFDPLWSGAIIVINHNIYKYYEDKKLLSKYYPAMKDYMDTLANNTTDYLFTDKDISSLGDWCDLSNEGGMSKTTSNFFVSNVFHVILLKYMLYFAKELEDVSAIDIYSSRIKKIIDKINKKWFDYEKSLYFEDSQAAIALCAYYNIIPKAHHKKAVDNLISMIEKNNNHINCGIIGTWAIFDLLSKEGYKNKALDILLNTDYPSYGNMLENGATTLWEDWKGKSSLNHPMFGTVDAWIHKNIGGIDYINGEYTICIPDIKEITHAKTGLHSKDGFVIIEWEKTDKGYEINIDAPKNLIGKLKIDNVQ